MERGLRVIARAIEQAAGTSAAQLFVLEQLSDGRAMSLTELAALTFTDRSSVSEVVNRLVDAGLATREVARSDRRRAAVRITASGRRALARAPTTPARRLIDAVGGLPPRVRRELASSLGHLNTALRFDADRPHMLFEETTR